MSDFQGLMMKPEDISSLQTRPRNSFTTRSCAPPRLAFHWLASRKDLHAPALSLSLLAFASGRVRSFDIGTLLLFPKDAQTKTFKISSCFYPSQKNERPQFNFLCTLRHFSVTESRAGIKQTNALGTPQKSKPTPCAHEASVTPRTAAAGFTRAINKSFQLRCRFPQFGGTASCDTLVQRTGFVGKVTHTHNDVHARKERAHTATMTRRLSECAFKSGRRAPVAAASTLGA
ncbi:hypothetical protein EVAR_103473_1 [Eumeta japonica]|uniref:Uncharacterized protein n=1 Tax=Eumeta variegata TaxID=151549 RepID=A0A4C1YTS5_EUMVA|nr:hypothetical protein EVAR_103473_1 [Eumeta japonica]